MGTRTTLAALLLVALAAPAPTRAEPVTETLSSVEVPDPPRPRFGGTVVLETSVGRGSFIRDEAARRPLASLYVSARPEVRVARERALALGLAFDFDVNLVENADSESTRPHQVRAGDLELFARWDELATWEAGHLSFGAALGVKTPTSLLSRFQTKILGLTASTATTWQPTEWLGVAWSFTVTKNINRYRSAVLRDDAFDLALPSRAGGAEVVAEGRTATQLGVTSFLVGNALSLEFSFLDRFTASLGWELVHAFSYNDYPKDALAADAADGGRGRTDVMAGSIEVGVEVIEHLSVALGTLVQQAPKTADNRHFRFPFWDTSNGADNRQVFYLDVTGTF
ncbi:MAG: hypothetical protein H6746_00185 [Deltaproteobacteria bacterium]|nr:hypothetical protein [Deltaproteobacteria bacterium]